MTEINFYKPGELDTTFEVPTVWDELDKEELILFANAITENLSKQELIINIVNNRAKGKLPKDWVARLDHEQAAIELLPLVELLLEDNNLTKQPFPHVRWLFRKYYGPADDFNDLKVGEFEDAEHFFLKYSRHKDPEYLQKIAAILWRPKVGAKRVSYTGYNADQASFSRRLSPATLQIIYLWYAGCRSQLPKIFRRVFEASSELANGEPDLMAVTTLIHHGAGPKNGTRDQVRETILKEFLYDCELLAKQQEELEEELEKMRRKNK